MKHILLKAWLMLVCLLVGSGASWADITGTIKFSTNDVKINAASVTGKDDRGNTWRITTVGTSSFTANSAYYQIGSGKSPASSITFTTTLSSSSKIKKMSAKFGGFTNTTGTVALKVGSTAIGSGSLNGTNDVTVNASSSATGTDLSVTVTGIDKGVKVYNISYTIEEEGGSSDPVDASWAVSPESVSLIAGKTETATITTNYDGTLSVSSANSEVATATIDGKVITVTGVAAGSTTLTVSGSATSTYNAISKTINVVVVEDDEPSGDGTTYNFADMNNFSSWGSSYEKKTTTFSDGAYVELASANKSTTTITDCPVTKGGDVIFKAPTGKKIASLTFTCTQWTTKEQTITLNTSSDGKNYTATSKTSSNFVLSASNLTDVTAVKFTFSSSSNQIGIKSIEVTYADDGDDPTPSDKVLSSVTVTGTPEVFWTGDEFSHNGMTVTATYDDDTQGDVTSNAIFSTPDLTTTGTKTVTVSYTENEVTKTATYDVEVRTIANTAETAYTVAEARGLIDAGKGLKQGVYVKGIVSEIVTAFNVSYGNISFNVSADGETTGDQFQFFRNFKGTDKQKWTSAEEAPKVGFEVVGYGLLTKYSSTYEFGEGNYIVAMKSGEKETATITATHETSLVVDATDEYDVDYDGDGTLSVASSDESVATVAITDNHVVVTAVAVGTATITISAPATDAYLAANYEYELTVEDGVTKSASWVAANKGYSNAQVITSSKVNDDINLVFTKGEGNAPAYYATGTGVRLYKGGNMQVKAAEGYVITKMTMTSENSTSFVARQGSMTPAAKAVWTGYETAVDIYYTAATGHVRIQQLDVTYTKLDEVGEVTVSAAGYATFCPSANVLVGDGTKSFTIAAEEGGVLTLSEAPVVCAGEGVILKDEGTYKLYDASGFSVAEPATNWLKGVNTDTPAPAGSYVLQNLDGRVGFYMVAEGEEPTVGAGKAYLDVPAGGSIKAYFFDAEDVEKDNETAIDNAPAANDQQSAAIYNLAGQRVSKAQKGMYIVNGKKVLF